MGRTTPIIQEIISVLDSELDDTEYALDRLEDHFHDRLLVDVGDTKTVATAATQLRLSVIEEECSRVLDHIGDQKMVTVNIDIVETAINELFEDRFTEP